MGTFVHAASKTLRIHSGFRQAIAAIVTGLLILVCKYGFGGLVRGPFVS